MIDTYLCSSNAMTLGAVCAEYLDVIGPMQGRAGDGETPSVGDPEMYYACIRYSGAITPPEGVAVCDAQTGQAVVGVWA